MGCVLLTAAPGPQRHPARAPDASCRLLVRKPYPTKKTLGERLNLKPRRVQQIMAELEQAGFVKREKRVSHRGQLSNSYDLSGLVAKLRALEPDFRRAEEVAREGRRQAARPQGRMRQIGFGPAV